MASDLETIESMPSSPDSKIPITQIKDVWQSSGLTAPQIVLAYVNDDLYLVIDDYSKLSGPILRLMDRYGLIYGLVKETCIQKSLGIDKEEQNHYTCPDNLRLFNAPYTDREKFMYDNLLRYLNF